MKQLSFKMIFSLIVIFKFCLTSFAQNPIHLKRVDTNVLATEKLRSQQLPSQVVLYRQNVAQVAEFVHQIHPFYNDATFNSLIILPIPDEGEVSFNLENSQILSEQFQKENAFIKTFKGVSTDKRFLLYLTLSDAGILAKIVNQYSHKVYYIEPVDRQNPTILMVYDEGSLHSEEIETLSCGNELMEQFNEDHNLKTMNGSINIPGQIANNYQLRIFRLAVTATSKYTQFYGTKNNAIANIVFTINNINAIYERDVAVRFHLITNTSLVYDNASPYPYSNINTFNIALLQANTNILNTQLGSQGYDLGILFHYGKAGGLAYLNSVCIGNNKGGAVAGFSKAYMHSYFESTVAHEIGHKFSAGHSMSANEANCGAGSYNANASFEVGGGSSLMSYAGNCGALSYQKTRDFFFHAGSIAQMKSFINTLSCYQTSTLNYAAPQIEMQDSVFYVPKATPFKLELTASSSSPNNLTTAFNQIDVYGSGGSATLPNGMNTFGPLFKTKAPATASERYFPSLESLAYSPSSEWEVLSNVARTINFKAVVRNNNPLELSSSTKNIKVIVNNCNPFEFTNLKSATSLVANGTNTVTLKWNTATPCIQASHVTIKFSTDGGLTFPYTLLNETPNDGTETIIVPNLPTCNGRFMIEAKGQIYFNINEGAINIVNNNCAANGTSISPKENISYPEGSPFLNLNLHPLFGNLISTPITGQILNSSSNSTLVALNTTNNKCQPYLNYNKYNSYEFYVSKDGEYSFNLTGVSGLVIHLYEGEYSTDNGGCDRFLKSSAHGPNINVIQTPGFTSNLCKNKKYTLVVATVGNNIPSSLPASYSVNITNADGGYLLNGPANPGFNYYYVIVNGSQIIKKITETPDLSNNYEFVADEYSIYGMSTAASLTNLKNFYENKNFNILNLAVLNQVGGLCAQLSQNVKKVKINSLIDQSLPIHLIYFKGEISPNNTSILSWKIENSEDIASFIVEKSYDSKNFEKIAVVSSKKEQNTYSLEDKNLQLNGGQVFYRLKLVEQNEVEQYSKIIALQIKKGLPSYFVYPNPIKGRELKIRFSEPLTSVMQIALTNVLGSTFFKAEFKPEGGKFEYILSLPDLKSGVYYLQLANQQYSDISKIVVTE